MEEPNTSSTNNPISPLGAEPKTKRTQRLYALLTLIVFIVLVAAVSTLVSNHISKQHAQNARLAAVTITPKGFIPATLTVKLGTKITWTNTDSKLHQVASNPYPKDTDLKSLKSEILNNSQTYTYTANTAGSYGYHDQLKPTINGTIVVQKQ